MKIDISHIAKLANLPLTLDETKKFQVQLSSILDYMQKLNEIDTKGIKETSQTTELTNITKNDETTPSLTQEEALSNTKNQYNGLFKVKAIFEE